MDAVRIHSRAGFEIDDIGSGHCHIDTMVNVCVTILSYPSNYLWLWSSDPVAGYGSTREKNMSTVLLRDRGKPYHDVKEYKILIYKLDTHLIQLISLKLKIKSYK